MNQPMLASLGQTQQSGCVATASSGVVTTGVITVKSSGTLVHFTPASAKWLSDEQPLRVGDAWYAGLAEPVRLSLQREWMMHRLDGSAASVQPAPELTFCFASSDSTRQVVVEFAVPVVDAATDGLLIGTVRVSSLKQSDGSCGSKPMEFDATDISQPEGPDLTDIQYKLLRTIGHEMQQPIYAIQNLMFAARQHLKMGQADQVGEMLTKIERQIVRAREFGDRLRQFATQTPTMAGPTDLHEVIDACREMVQIYAADARASVQFALQAFETSVVCDPLQIQQVLLNLVRNATDSLVLIDSQTRTLKIETLNDGGTVCIRVVDTGPGVTDEDHERIFDHFFTTKDSGLGIGLSYCRSVITAHGGKLTLAENRPGRVVFEVRLPVTP